MSRRALPAPASFQRWSEAALRSASRTQAAQIAIRLIDTAEGRELNRRYRGKNYATNVLSFAAELPRGVNLPFLGDIVICAPVVAREAAEQRKSLRDHYAHLSVHGVLHLLGYDHENSADATRMETLEQRILAGFGIADPY